MKCNLTYNLCTFKMAQTDKWLPIFLFYLLYQRDFTCDKVTAHIDFLQFWFEFVFSKPNRVILLVELLPKVRDRLGFLFVGIESFEVIHVEGATDNTLESYYHWILPDPIEYQTAIWPKMLLVLECQTAKKYLFICNHVECDVSETIVNMSKNLKWYYYCSSSAVVTY